MMSYDVCILVYSIVFLLTRDFGICFVRKFVDFSGRSFRKNVEPGSRVIGRAFQMQLCRASLRLVSLSTTRVVLRPVFVPVSF